MTSIGRRCKGGDALSRAVLIARRLPWGARGGDSPPPPPEKRNLSEPAGGSDPPRPLARNSTHHGRRPARGGRRPKPQSGGYSGGAPPLPIPNREVKPARADGTAHERGRVGRRHLRPPGRTRVPPGGFTFWGVPLLRPPKKQTNNITTNPRPRPQSPKGAVCAGLGRGP